MSIRSALVLSIALLMPTIASPMAAATFPQNGTFSIASAQTGQCASEADDHSIALVDCAPQDKHQQWRTEETNDTKDEFFLQNLATSQCISFQGGGRDFPLNTRSCQKGAARYWKWNSTTAISTPYSLPAGPNSPSRTTTACWYAVRNTVRAAPCRYTENKLWDEFKWKVQKQKPAN
ncbi:ricin-type beta-trefoil lectin protein [Nocardia tenerifensis]|uniref:Ricin-type beta-trefoil lectin protein n=1 Tax=Nocardia tenerifensis TaxID=228006 RepID=A0A318JXQ0_9NOCA|nr:RICIN domain-containing protein [Nocardia tenerifensis]PXX61758.1 ricin-type beta-trefoil lectin protein [Nocardia tenerifensis]